MLIIQIVASLAGAEFCGWMARGLKLTKKDEVEFVVAHVVCIVASVTYLAALSYLFWKKEPVTDELIKFREEQADFWCYYQFLRSVGVVGLLLLFAYISDVLAARRGLDGYSVAFFYCSHLHVVSLTKLFTMEDLVCLSDSLLAIGVTLAFKLDHEKKYGRSAGCYIVALALVYFRFSHVPYGNDETKSKTRTSTCTSNRVEV